MKSSTRFSGVDWIGKIPSDWSVASLKRYASYISRGKSPDYANKGIPIINQACIYWDGLKLENVKFQDPDSANGHKGKLYPGDLLINSTGTGTLGRLGVFNFDEEYCADSHVTIVRPTKELLTKYLYYLLQTNIYQGYIYSVLSSGATNQIELSREGLSNTPIIVPPFQIQEAIAHFLDRKTAAIDTLIAKKQRLIQLLEEKRTALINQAVTKGINLDAPMKDSGILWIGKIPKHWKTLKLKHVSKLYRGKFTHRPRNDPKLYGGSYPFLQTGDIARADKFIENYNQTLNELGTQVSVCFPSHTIVMSIAANIGNIAITSFDAYFPDSVIGFTPKFPLFSDFLYYLLLAMKSAFDQESVENTQRNLNIDRVGNIDIPLPIIEEQEQIAKHLKASLTKQANIKILLNKQIEKLQEYRQSLITAAVTGKIDISQEEAA